MDNPTKFCNMLFIFAESDSVENKSESLDDPAFKSRKANITYTIADISSETEYQANRSSEKGKTEVQSTFDVFIPGILRTVVEKPCDHGNESNAAAEYGPGII